MRKFFKTEETKDTLSDENARTDTCVLGLSFLAVEQSSEIMWTGEEFRELVMGLVIKFEATKWCY